MSSHLESRDTEGLHSLIADGTVIHVDACHGSVHLQSFSQCLAKGKRLGSRSRLTSVRPHEIQRRHNSQFPTFRLRVSKEQFPLYSGQMSLTQRCTSSQYHANIPVESIPGIPHHTTQNEFKSKRNSPTSLTVNKFEDLEMRRMSMSRLQSLSTTWRNRHYEQPLGIPGHKRPSLPQRRWNCHPNRCLSRKCSSSKLQLVPGQRESDLEVDQGICETS